jgi:hypothetical protein
MAWQGNGMGMAWYVWIGLYRPGEALRVPWCWDSQISRQLAHEGCKVVSPTHRPPLPQEIFLVLISARGWVNPKVILWLEWLCQWKIPATPSGIEPATFQLVAECLNQLRYHVPPIQMEHRVNILVDGLYNIKIWRKTLKSATYSVHTHKHKRLCQYT